MPGIEYGDIFLVGPTVGNRKKLQTLQNKGLRCALDKEIETSIEDLHSEADILRLKFRREQHLLNFMFDMSGQEENVKKKINAGVTTRSQKRKLLKVSRLKSEKLKKV